MSDHRKTLKDLAAFPPVSMPISAAEELKRALGGSLTSDALKQAGISDAKSSYLDALSTANAATDYLKQAGIGATASDAYKQAGISDAKSSYLDALSTANAATDYLKQAGIGATVANAYGTTGSGGADYSKALSAPARATGGLGHVAGSSTLVSAPTSRPGQVPVASPGALGQVVRQAREALGMTQAAFADAAGVGRRFVSELENGKTTLELGKVMAVCAAAGLDLLAVRR